MAAHDSAELHHFIRGSFRLASKNYCDELRRDSVIYRPFMMAPKAATARVTFEETAKKWDASYPSTVKLNSGRSKCEGFIPLLDHAVKIRTMIRSTNPIESLNTCYRRAVKARGFRTEGAALK